jgi:lipopolysaccharide assembly protein B
MFADVSPLLLGGLLLLLVLLFLVMRRGLDRSPRGDGLHPDYLKGLNYLLNEETDRAIDLFVRMAELDSETVETHFALGSLFRRRGEVDRAIRIHQNLIARPNLRRDQRQQALFALGEDYMRAGLQDRAENLFQELVDTPRFRKRALAQLATIYELQKDWEQAITVRRRLQVISGGDDRHIIAQYLCEQAEAAGTARDARGMRALLRKAISQDKGSLRALILQAELADSEGDGRGAAASYRRILDKDSSYAVLLLPKLRRVLRGIGKPEEFEQVVQNLERNAGPAARADVALALVLSPELEEPATLRVFRSWVETEAAFVGTLRLLDGRGDGTSDRMLLDAVRGLLDGRERFRCGECGFAGHVHYWQCPSCKAWDSTRPISLAGGLFPEPEEKRPLPSM